MRTSATCLLLLARVAAYSAPPIPDEGVAPANLQIRLRTDDPAPKPAATYSTTINFCLSEIRASFAALDANGDGVLSKAEVTAALGLAPATNSTAPAATATSLATPAGAASATSSDASPTSAAAVDAAPAASATATASTAAPAAPAEVEAVSTAATEATTAEPTSSAVLETPPPPPPPPSPEASPPPPPPPAAAAAKTSDVLVTVPAGVVSGQQLDITSPFGGAQLRITVPAGAPTRPRPPNPAHRPSHACLTARSTPQPAVRAAGVVAGQQLRVSVPVPAAAAPTVSVPPPPPPVAATSELSEGAILAAAPLTTSELAPAADAPAEGSKTKVQAYPQHTYPRYLA